MSKTILEKYEPPRRGRTCTLAQAKSIFGTVRLPENDMFWNADVEVFERYHIINAKHDPHVTNRFIFRLTHPLNNGAVFWMPVEYITFEDAKSSPPATEYVPRVMAADDYAAIAKAAKERGLNF